MGEHLGLHQITYAINISLNEEKNMALITRELDDEKVVVEAQLPVLVTFTKTDDLRFASIKNKMKSKRAEIKEINYDDLPGIDDTKIGLKGSPTRVVKSFTRMSRQMALLSEKTILMRLLRNLSLSLKKQNCIDGER